MLFILGIVLGLITGLLLALFVVLCETKYSFRLTEKAAEKLVPLFPAYPKASVSLPKRFDVEKREALLKENELLGIDTKLEDIL